jgi:hypothetical protein
MVWSRIGNEGVGLGEDDVDGDDDDDGDGGGDGVRGGVLGIIFCFLYKV